MVVCCAVLAVESNCLLIIGDGIIVVGSVEIGFRKLEEMLLAVRLKVPEYLKRITLFDRICRNSGQKRFNAKLVDNGIADEWSPASSRFIKYAAEGKNIRSRVAVFSLIR